MKDARLAELMLLSDLDTLGHKRLQFVDNLPPENYYGLTRIAFQQMLLYLVTEGLINGDAQLLDYGTNGKTADQAKDKFIIQDVEYIKRWQLDAYMNHRGRLRLQQLRDELRSTRTKEPFGILYSEEFRLRDLVIGFAFLPVKSLMSVLFMDLDNFKGVNDSKSHEVGDMVMRQYLQIVRDLTERAGEAYRGRGDEVTVILPEADGDRAQKIAEAIRAKIEADFKELKALEGLKDKPTASIGAVTCVAGVKPAEVFRLVDEQMYVAKKGGKNRVAWQALAAPM